MGTYSFKQFKQDAWKVIEFALILLGAQMIVSMVVMGGVAAYQLITTQSIDEASLQSTGISYSLLLGNLLVILFLLWQYIPLEGGKLSCWQAMHEEKKERLRAEYGFSFSRGAWALSILCIICYTFYVFPVNVLLEQAGVPDALLEVYKVLMNDPVGILGMALVGPVTEELIFRGGVQGYLQKRGYAPWVCILVASVLFGIIHFNPLQTVGATLIGIAYGWLYYRTRNLFYPILCHVLNNSYAVASSYIFTENMSYTDLLGGTTQLLLALVVSVVLCYVFYRLILRNLGDKKTA